MKMINEFKKFAIKGNMVDMAVGIIIGLAFGKIVSSFVNDVLMPPLGILLGGMDFTALVYTIKEAVGEQAAVTINYGNFIQSTLDFIIVAFAAFMMIKAMNRLSRKEEAKPPAPPKPTVDQQLLAEIRDLLKKDQF